MEHEDRVALGDLPALREARRHFAGLRVVVGEPLEQRDVDARFRLAGADLRIQRLRLAARHVPQHLASGGVDLAEVPRSLDAAVQPVRECGEHRPTDADAARKVSRRQWHQLVGNIR